MRVHLNLATQPLENNRRFVVGSGVLGGAALIVLVFLAGHVFNVWRANTALRKEIGGYEDRIEKLQRQRQDLSLFFQNPQTREATERAAFLNSLIEQRSFPWTKIFMDLEHTLPTGVRVISIAPRMEKGKVQLKLVVGALTDEGILKFLKALEASKMFSDVQPKQGSHPTQGGTTDRVMLELEVWYATI